MPMSAANPMRVPNLLLRWLLGPVNLQLLRLVMRRPEYRTLRIGQTTFYGPPEFVRVCEEAMTSLAKVDPQVYEGLTEGYRYVVWYGEHRLSEDLITGVFSIDDSFLSWGTLGVTARLVEAYHTTVLTERKLRNVLSGPDADKLIGQMKTSTREWLISHDYPHELTECYI